MERFFFHNVIVPFYFDYRGYDRFRHYNELKKRDLLTLDELKQIQWKRLETLIKHCYETIPYYNRIFNKLGIHYKDIKSLDDYSKAIPELTKQDIRDYYHDLIDPNLSKDQICEDSTSGSTGIPLKFVRSFEDQEFGFALRYRSNEWCGWEPHHKSVWFVSDTRHITELNKLKGKMALWLKRRLLIDTKKITKENMWTWVKQIEAFRPKRVYGYSSLLAEFSHFIINNNIKIKGIKGVFSTAEALMHREEIKQAFNAPVYDQYGASEVTCIGHECKKGSMHLNLDEVLTEFIDIPGNIEIKKVLCTPLYIYGMPLLRYEIGDCAVSVEKHCDCGLPYPVIELKIGRTSGNIISPTGKLVSGITFGWYLTDATIGIKQFQLIQEDVDNFILKIVCQDDSKYEREQIIRELMYEMLNTSDISIKFEYPEKILPENNGKYRPIISKVLNCFPVTNKKVF